MDKLPQVLCLNRPINLTYLNKLPQVLYSLASGEMPLLPNPSLPPESRILAVFKIAQSQDESPHDCHVLPLTHLLLVVQSGKSLKEVVVNASHSEKKIAAQM